MTACYRYDIISAIEIKAGASGAFGEHLSLLIQVLPLSCRAFPFLMPGTWRWWLGRQWPFGSHWATIKSPLIKLNTCFSGHLPEPWEPIFPWFPCSWDKMSLTCLIHTGMESHGHWAESNLFQMSILFCHAIWEVAVYSSDNTKRPQPYTACGLGQIDNSLFGEEKKNHVFIQPRKHCIQSFRQEITNDKTSKEEVTRKWLTCRVAKAFLLRKRTAAQALAVFTGWQQLRQGVCSTLMSGQLCSDQGQPSPALARPSPREGTLRAPWVWLRPPAAGLPAWPRPAGGAAARTAPGASGAARPRDPAPAASRAETPASPGPAWPCPHLCRKAAPRLWTLKGRPEFNQNFKVEVLNRCMTYTLHLEPNLPTLRGPSCNWEAQSQQRGLRAPPSTRVCLKGWVWRLKPNLRYS